MSVFHAKRPTPKHVENSIRGIRQAKRQGFTEIDLDMLITKDGRVVGCHWPRPMLMDGFRDPKRKLDRNRTVASMTFLEVRRLVAGRWPRRYRIQPIEVLLRECGKQGVGAVLEPKGDKRFDNSAIWSHLGKLADQYGCHLRVYALPENASALPFAKTAGIKAKEIR